MVTRVLDWRPKGHGSEPHLRHCVVSLSKTHPCLVLGQPRNLKIVDWDVKNQNIKHLFTLQTGDYDLIINCCIDSASSMSFKNVQGHVELIKIITPDVR